MPSPPVMASAPMPPRRKFNMTFLPVNAAPEAEPSVTTEDVSAPKQTDVDGMVEASARATLPSPSSSVSCADQSPDAGYLTPVSPEAETQTQTHLSSSTPSTSSSSGTSASSPMSPPPSLSLSLPILSAAFQRAVESDTETETDTYTDTDAESDAPSTSTMNSSLPSSPPCDDDAIEEDLTDLKLDGELVPPGYYPRIHRDSDAGSYFPPLVPADSVIPVHIPAHLVVANASTAHSSRPGQTPPLSVLFPSPQSQTQPLPALEPAAPREESQTPVVPTSLEREGNPPPPTALSSLALSSALGTAPASDSSQPATPLSISRALQKKLMLEALPSPALVPPSPFELEPEPLHAAPQGMTPDATEEVIGKLESLRVAAKAEKADKTPVLSASTTPDDSPLLTLESMRAAWDAKAWARLGPAANRLGGGAGTGMVISPSLSRRRSSS